MCEKILIRIHLIHYENGNRKSIRQSEYKFGSDCDWIPKISAMKSFCQINTYIHAHKFTFAFPPIEFTWQRNSFRRSISITQWPAMDLINNIHKCLHSYFTLQQRKWIESKQYSCYNVIPCRIFIHGILLHSF